MTEPAIELQLPKPARAVGPLLRLSIVASILLAAANRTEETANLSIEKFERLGKPQFAGEIDHHLLFGCRFAPTQTKLVIWNASSLHYMIALESLERRAHCGECSC